MDIEVQRYLYDIQVAGELIQTFVVAQTFDSDRVDALLRSAVERQFITIGEALNHVNRLTFLEVVEQRLHRYMGTHKHQRSAHHLRRRTGVSDKCFPRVAFGMTNLLGQAVTNFVTCL